MSERRDTRVADLTAGQKRFLRGLGQKLPVGVSVGKAGLSEALVRQVTYRLEQQELVKVRLAEGPPDERRVAASALAQAAGAVRVSLVGRNAVLYRLNGKLPDDKRIALP